MSHSTRTGYIPCLGCRLWHMAGGELIREARLRAGLTQTELSKLTGRERSVIARWEQGVISPPVDSLIEIIQACGFDLPFTLLPIDKTADEELREALLATPSQRVEWLLEDTGAEACPRGAMRGRSWPAGPLRYSTRTSCSARSRPQRHLRRDRRLRPRRPRHPRANRRDRHHTIDAGGEPRPPEAALDDLDARRADGGAARPPQPRRAGGRARDARG